MLGGGGRGPLGTETQARRPQAGRQVGVSAFPRPPRPLPPAPCGEARGRLQKECGGGGGPGGAALLPPACCFWLPLRNSQPGRVPRSGGTGQGPPHGPPRPPGCAGARSAPHSLGSSAAFGPGGRPVHLSADPLRQPCLGGTPGLTPALPPKLGVGLAHVRWRLLSHQNRGPHSAGPAPAPPPGPSVFLENRAGTPQPTSCSPERLFFPPRRRLQTGPLHPSRTQGHSGDLGLRFGLGVRPHGPRTLPRPEPGGPAAPNHSSACLSLSLSVPP